MSWLLLILGLGLLVAGAEMLVRGGSALAARLGMSSLVIGLTIVAFGTSAPELAVSAKAALAGQPDIALGNVIGSNIFNVLFILGVSALITPLVVSQQLVRIDVPIMIAISMITLLMSLDGKLGQVDGLIFLAVFLAYTFLAIRIGKQESKQVQQEYEKEFGEKKIAKDKSGKAIFMQSLLILGGLAVLVIGARVFVDASIGIARSFGISELVIALSIVAAGTSMPEVATSIMASIRGERDIAVGNVIGSNIFNLAAILGIACLLAGPEGIQISKPLFDFDLPVMIAVAVACLPIFFTGHKISRWEGAVFSLYYVFYVMYLIFKASEHDQLQPFSSAMIMFVMPITVLTMVVIYFQSRNNPKGVSK